MTSRLLRRLVPSSILLLLLVLVLLDPKNHTTWAQEPTEDTSDNTVHIAIVSCTVSNANQKADDGNTDRPKEALASMRSILLSTTSSNHQNATTNIHFHIIHGKEDSNHLFFHQHLSSWQQQWPFFLYSLYRAQLPTQYYDLFAPCACQRLFLHTLLPLSVEKILYVDSDTLILVDILELWNVFETQFTSNTIAAMAGEHELTSEHAYYKNQAQHPYYDKGVHGLNSGVLLLDLRKLRLNPWEEELEMYRQLYSLQFYDQDLLNIYFGIHPERLVLLSCEWNYRHDHCFFSKQHCPSVKLLHGNRGTFHRGPKQYQFGVHSFVAVFNAFNDFENVDIGNCHGECLIGR